MAIDHEKLRLKIEKTLEEFNKVLDFCFDPDELDRKPSGKTTASARELLNSHIWGKLQEKYIEGYHDLQKAFRKMMDLADVEHGHNSFDIKEVRF